MQTNIKPKKRKGRIIQLANRKQVLERIRKELIAMQEEFEGLQNKVEQHLEEIENNTLIKSKEENKKCKLK